jgi:hypothetical protein
MSVRGFLLGLAASAALLSPMAASAREEAREAPRMEEAVRTLETLNDPKVQRDMGNVLSALVGSLMQLRVGEIANAVEDMDMPGQDRSKARGRKMDPKTTLADLAGKGDPDFADKLDDNVRAMPKMAGAMAGTLAQMLPMMDAMARDLEAQIEDALPEGMRKKAKERAD